MVHCEIRVNRCVAMQRHGDSTGIISEHLELWKMFGFLVSKLLTKIWHQSFIECAFEEV